MLKKILLFFSLLLIIVAYPVNAEESEITVYAFTKDDCSSCKNAITYFKELLDSEEYSFNLVEFRVFDDNFLSYSADLYNLLDEVYTYFDYDLASIGSVPTIVIGDFFYNGYPMDTTILSDAIDNYGGIDVVDEVATTLELSIEDMAYAGDDEESDESNIEIIIFCVIFGFILVSSSILVIISKK